MLIEFSCSNFKSIKEKITFSFVAGRDETKEDELKNLGSLRLTRSAVIYGPNGSGKSNFIGALSFVQALVVNSINHQPGANIFMNLHKLSDKNELSTYSVQFIKQGIRYAYGFSLQHNKVVEEYLYTFPNDRQVKVFERDEEGVTEGSSYKSKFGSSYDVLKQNRLFLSCIANYSKLEEMEEVFRFFSEDIVIYNPNQNNWHMYTAENLNANKQMKDTFIKILSSIGVEIIDVRANIRELSISDLPQFIADHVKSISPDEKFKQPEFKLVYKEFETDLMNEESDGIKRLFEIICPIIDIINNGKILVCDELESSFHEMVVCELIKLFNNAKNNEFAQLLFSTHDTGLLDSSLFRRDQIWFTELNKQRATNLYSLTEIRNVRKHENFVNGYINGKYGAIPLLSSNISSLFNNKDKEGVDNI